MKTPPFLKKGATIALISTARKITKKELEPALQVLASWELHVVLGKSIGAAAAQFAGDDEVRANDLQTMLDDPNIDAIWFARGGYGTVRIIDALDFSAFRKNPKWLIGYSDITVLHSHVHNFGIETLHAQMPLELEAKSEATRQSIFKVLFGRDYRINVSSESAVDNRNGNATGQLIGGNLSLLYSLVGSVSDIDTRGKILFIEDLDEMLYHVDRMMMNLKRSGKLEHLAGLIVGGMSDMSDNTIPFGKTANQIIHDAVKTYDFPVCYDFPAGHIQDNRALVMGRTVTLTVTDANVEVVF
ncbi:S66 peptidase family protein [Cochleicola gelatinilyticus]|uniref:LD-carboxypeptidase n=1 Tax=Cochleicola gelatinilyticus TaxID=1763537 RepID=A0A167J7C2_9FLAO|nr:LD-carboxypeptidase [Cochleicola gelatinilyticus]OAB80393.1 LD-carboxypeptidase [Cochleicola gelatinilyticus]